MADTCIGLTVHIPHIGVLMFALVVPEAQEVQADQLQDYPENHTNFQWIWSFSTETV